MDQERVRAVGRRHGLEPLDDGGGVPVGEPRQAARDLDREEGLLARREGMPPIRSGAWAVVSHCPSSAASFTGCVSATCRAAQSPTTTWTGASARPNARPSASAPAVVRVAAPSQHPRRVHRGDREPRRHVGGQHHVRGHHRRRRVQHRADRVDVHQRAAAKSGTPSASASTRSRSRRTTRSRPRRPPPARPTTSASRARAGPSRRGRSRGRSPRGRTRTPRARTGGRSRRPTGPSAPARRARARRTAPSRSRPRPRTGSRTPSSTASRAPSRSRRPCGWRGTRRTGGGRGRPTPRQANTMWKPSETAICALAACSDVSASPMRSPRTASCHGRRANPGRLGGADRLFGFAVLSRVIAAGVVRGVVVAGGVAVARRLRDCTAHQIRIAAQIDRDRRAPSTGCP